ncbi:procathepsin L-like [Dysidea avara]|uniref:procathepsin L-like n=1 Tax=Dysidea avara TaxID=196820 RepID=UPI00332E0539
MKAIVALMCLAVASAVEYSADWQEWKDLHGKTYECEHEELARYTVYVANKAYIEEHNKNADAHGYTLKMNEFGDLDATEFGRLFNGFKGVQAQGSCGAKYTPAGNIPDAVDWRTKGYVTPVKNQGQCGSCWAFSTTGSLEGQHFKQTGQLVSLSEQNLVDCSQKYGNHGCEGGLMDDGFAYIKDNGIDSEASYPYRAHDEKCAFKPQNVVANDTGCVDIKSKDEAGLTDAIAHIGPISVAMDASHSSFQFYSRGVYEPFFCSQTRLDHGVLAVGYGTDEGKDIFIVKNSWGTSWGMDGYFNLIRGKNKCGISTAASFPTV